MANTTVTVIPIVMGDRPRETGLASTWTWTLVPNRAFATLKVRGITHDGTYLWFSTDGSSFLGEPAHFVKVDITNKTKLHQYDYSLSNPLMDIAWNGDGFYAIEQIGAGRNLVSIHGSAGNSSAIHRKALLATLSSTARGIDYDGYYIWIRNATHIQQYEPGGKKVREFLDILSGPEGGGITHNGGGGVIENLDELIAPGCILIGYEVMSGKQQWLETVNTSNNGNDESPIVLEWRKFPRRRGYNMYRFRSSV